MRYIPALLLLASCQSWGWSETADALLPDEVTLGNGSGNSAFTGQVDTWWENEDWPVDIESESKSTFASLTWHIPSVKSDNGMSRETQRNLALLVDQMASEQGLTVSDGAPEVVEAPISSTPLQLNLREGVSLPPKEVLFGVLGALVLALMFFRYQKSQSSRRRW